MGEAHYRFYAELNDFLPPERRFTAFADAFLDISTVKDRMESFGVPHTEVDLILVNGEAVDFTYRVRDGDRISVYPVFEAFDIAAAARLRPEPLRVPRFILDTHLGRLAAYLRVAQSYLEAAAAGRERLTPRDQAACHLLWRRLVRAVQLDLPFPEPPETFAQHRARVLARPRSRLPKAMSQECSAPAGASAKPSTRRARKPASGIAPAKRSRRSAGTSRQKARRAPR